MAGIALVVSALELVVQQVVVLQIAVMETVRVVQEVAIVTLYVKNMAIVVLTPVTIVDIIAD